MPDRGRKIAKKSRAANSKKPPVTSKAESGNPAQPQKRAKPAPVGERISPAKKQVAKGKAGSRTGRPRLVHRDGVAYLEKYDIPVWQLEMARRARSSPADLIAAFPGLTRQGLDLAFAPTPQSGI